MFYLLELISNYQPATWKVEISGEPGMIIDQQILDTLYKTVRSIPPKIYKPSKITVKFLHPVPDDRFVYKRQVLIEKIDKKCRICEESSEPFLKLYWAFTYFDNKGDGQTVDYSLGYKPDLMLYKFGKEGAILSKWHLKNVSVISFSIESGLSPSIENCSMDIVPEKFLKQL